MAGIGLAVKAANPSARLFTAEPKGYDDHRRSLESGMRERNASVAHALCDALLAVSPGELTWALNRTALAGGYAVDEEAVKRAMAFAFRNLKVVVEPGGAVALATLLEKAHPAAGRNVAVVLSGGNVDAPLFTACLAAESAR